MQDIHDDCLERLQALYDRAEHIGSDGRTHSLDAVTRIALPQAELLGRLVRQYERRRTLEIGFAFGFSTLAILGGLKGREGVQHTSIDPYEELWWNGIGLEKVKEAGCAGIHRWIAEPTHMAVPGLIAAGETFDFIYVDGDHRYDALLVDFTLAQKVLEMGGMIVIDDLWMPAVQTVVNFIRSNLALEEMPSTVTNVAVFRKAQEDGRDWWHFTPFQVDRRKGFF